VSQSPMYAYTKGTAIHATALLATHLTYYHTRALPLKLGARIASKSSNTLQNVRLSATHILLTWFTTSMSSIEQEASCLPNPTLSPHNQPSNYPPSFSIHHRELIPSRANLHHRPRRRLLRLHPRSPHPNPGRRLRPRLPHLLLPDPQHGQRVLDRAPRDGLRAPLRRLHCFGFHYALRAAGPTRKVRVPNDAPRRRNGTHLAHGAAHPAVEGPFAGTLIGAREHP